MSSAVGKTKPCYNWTFSHYYNLPQQLASKLMEHKNTGNFICHLIGGPIVGLASIALVQKLCGDYPALGCSIFTSLVALANDLPFGFIYTAINMSTTVYQLELFKDVSLYLILGMIAAGFSVQIGLGHGFFEGDMPTDEKAVVKFKSPAYNNFYFLNGVVFGTFHFYSILSLRLGLRPAMHSKVKEEFSTLKAVIDKVSQ